MVNVTGTQKTSIWNVTHLLRISRLFPIHPSILLRFFFSVISKVSYRHLQKRNEDKLL